jgi:hypothetical protein
MQLRTSKSSYKRWRLTRRRLGALFLHPGPLSWKSGHEEVFPLSSRRSLVSYRAIAHFTGLHTDKFTVPDLAESVVRCSPDEDATNGFFVSCFIRPGHGKEYGPIDDSIVVPPPSKRKTIDDEEDLNIPATAPSALKKRKKSKKKKTSMEGGPPATVAG